jgi:hypothetical protein
MSALLPALRGRLEFMSSPFPERPGLLLRDPLRYSEAALILPEALVPLLSFFDGQHGELDLKAALVRADGDLGAVAIAEQLRNALSQGGFLDDATFQGLRQASEARFAEAPTREPAHAGMAYPAEASALHTALAAWLSGEAVQRAETQDLPAPEPAVAWVDGDVPRPDTPARSAQGLLGIAAPHVSPEGGFASYRSAYAALGPEHEGRTFVVLGTSHYGAGDRFGLTRKPYRTPFGPTQAVPEWVDELAGQSGSAVADEDYCHAVEHSIEFQVMFLQQLYGPDVRVLPILCGPFLEGLAGGLPEHHDGVARFLEALGVLARREAERITFVLGVDLAHVGPRYGDAGVARAGEGALDELAGRDFDRLDRVVAGDAAGLWERVREGGDDMLRWCGASTLYTFLRALPARGRVLRYEQWNIDPVSVVSFAALAFWPASRAGAQG